MSLKSIQHRAYIALILFFAFMPVSYGVIRTIVLSSSQVSGVLPVSKGGTGSATAGDARTALGLATYSNTDSSWTNGEQLTVTHGSFSDVIVTGYKTVTGNAADTLLHYDGSNGSSTITDSGSTGLTWTASGATISTTQAKFGQSLRLGSTSDFVVSGTTNTTQASDASWTIDVWVWVDNASSMLRAVMDSGQHYQWLSSGGTWYFAPQGSGVSTGVSVSANTWTHLEACSDGSTIRLYVNGTASGTTSAVAMGGTNRTWHVGKIDGTGIVSTTTGYVDELKIEYGTCRHTSGFTPPAAPYGNPTGTKTGLRNGTDYTYTFDSSGTYITNASGSTLSTVRFDVFPIN